jgi:outer membrane protein
MTRARALVLALVGSLAAAPPSWAQTPPAAAAPPPHVLTLGQAIQYAVDHYPRIRAALEQTHVAEAGVDVARAAYLPRLESMWQVNRATANNVFGQLLPQSVIPALTGPVLDASSGRSVWGSAAGALFSWEPLDFGLRRANVAGAEAAVVRARAADALTRLEVESAVGNAFLSVVAAQRAQASAEADLERRSTLARTVRALVDNQLRPGAEASRAEAERAAAQPRVIQARLGLTLARTTLGRMLGTTGIVEIESAQLLVRIPPSPSAQAVVAVHPSAQVRQAAVDVARAQEQVLARTDFPRVYLQSSVFTRGTGADATGSLDGGLDGLAFDRANWAAGIQVVLPNLFGFSSLRARKVAASASTRAESAAYDEALLQIASGQQAAAATVDAARAVAANTPVQLAAAHESESQARARYQAGLAGIVEVADAQSLLAQAEFQDQLARVDVWRALLAHAAAQGSMTAFLGSLQTLPGAR